MAGSKPAREIQSISLHFVNMRVCACVLRLASNTERPQLYISLYTLYLYLEGKTISHHTKKGTKKFRSTSLMTHLLLWRETVADDGKRELSRQPAPHKSWTLSKELITGRLFHVKPAALLHAWRWKWRPHRCKPPSLRHRPLKIRHESCFFVSFFFFFCWELPKSRDINPLVASEASTRKLIFQLALIFQGRTPSACLSGSLSAITSSTFSVFLHTAVSLCTYGCFPHRFSPFFIYLFFWF